MKILVAGGAGFVGSYVVRRLVEKGHSITVVDNFSRGSEANLPGQCVVWKCGVRELRPPDLMGYDAIWDFAARVYGVRHLYDNPADLLVDNVETTIALLRSATMASIKSYVYISSSCVYDHPAVQVPHCEDDVGLCDTSYGWSKLFGEVLVRYHAEQYGLDTRIARLFNVYGPRDSLQSPHVIPDFILKALAIVRQETIEFPLIGTGSQTRDFTWVEDAADGIIAVAERGHPGEPYNVGTGREVSIFTLANLVCSLFGLTVAPNQRTACGLPYFVTMEAPEQDIQLRCADVEKIKQDTGWEAQVPLEDGLHRVKDWMVAAIMDGRMGTSRQTPSG